MNFRISPPLVVTAILGSVVATACSSKSDPPRAWLHAQIQAGATSGSCNQGSGQGLQIGPAGIAGQTVTRVNGGGAISVGCAVKAASGGFNVDIQSTDNTTQTGQGGSFHASGVVDSSGNGSNINVTLNAAGATYSQTNCTIANAFGLVQAGSPPNQNQPSIDPGRIWGEVLCDDAQLQGTGTQTFCKLTVDFVFENCSE
jgi:hypothetical protein